MRDATRSAAARCRQLASPADGHTRAGTDGSVRRCRDPSMPVRRQPPPELRLAIGHIGFWSTLRLWRVLRLARFALLPTDCERKFRRKQELDAELADDPSVRSSALSGMRRPDHTGATAGARIEGDQILPTEPPTEAAKNGGLSGEGVAVLCQTAKTQPLCRYASNRMPGRRLSSARLRPLGKSVRVQSAITPSRCEVRAFTDRMG